MSDQLDALVDNIIARFKADGELWKLAFCARRMRIPVRTWVMVSMIQWLQGDSTAAAAMKAYRAWQRANRMARTKAEPPHQ
jgi:hypothetical protein